MTVSKGACVLSHQFMLKLFLAFNQIIYENAADLRICKLLFLWMLYYTRFVLINRNVSTGNVDTSNAAYTSQKEQNHLLLPFYLFN